MSSQLITRMWMWTIKSQVQIPPIACFPSIKCFIYSSSLWKLNQPLVERTLRSKLNPLPLSMQSKQSMCMFTPTHSDHTIDTRKDDLKLEMQVLCVCSTNPCTKILRRMFIPGRLCTGSSYWLPSYPSVGNVPWNFVTWSISLLRHRDYTSTIVIIMVKMPVLPYMQQLSAGSHCKVHTGTAVYVCPNFLEQHISHTFHT